VRVRFVGAPSPTASAWWCPHRPLLRRGELTAVYLVTAEGDPTGLCAACGAHRVQTHGEAGVEVLAGLKAGDRVALDPVRAGLSGAQVARRVQAHLRHAMSHPNARLPR
jgi:hypothetical protein